MKAKQCVECEELCPDVQGWEVRCMAGFSPRYYQCGGFKRRCNCFVKAHDEDVESCKEDLVLMGY